MLLELTFDAYDTDVSSLLLRMLLFPSNKQERRKDANYYCEYRFLKLLNQSPFKCETGQLKFTFL